MNEFNTQSSLVVQFVLLVLAVSSIISWAIIFYKVTQLRTVAKHLRAMRAALDASRSHGDVAGLLAASDQLKDPSLATMIHAAADAVKTSSPEDMNRALKQWQIDEIERLESYLIFLATTGSVAPFVGLLGTVWGIMHAFQGIGASGSASLAVVAPAIGEALVATAAGLAAAIPAVMAYNFFVNWTRKLTNTIEGFSQGVQELLVSKVS